MKEKLSAKQQNGTKRRVLHTLVHVAEMALLPGEDPKEFEELYSLLVAEWSPDGPTEADAVLDMAKGMWRKARNQGMIAATIMQAVHDPQHALFDEARALSGCVRLLGTLGPERVDDCLASISKRDAEHLRQKFCKGDFKSELKWIEAIKNEILTVLLPTLLNLKLPAAPYLGLANPEQKLAVLYSASQVITAEVLDHELALEERNTAIIHRAMKRIIECKAMKQILKQSSANAGGDQKTNQKSKLTES
jgi:hypothetical protein